MDCTLITSCFDCSKYNKHSRSIHEAISLMDSLLKTPCNLVIYTDHILYEHVMKIRDKYGMSGLTKYIVMNIEDIDSFKYIDIVKKNRELYHPTKDLRTCAETHLIQCNKFEFVLKTIKSNPFNTTKFGWIDAYVGDNFKKMCTNYKNNMLLDILNRCDDDKYYIMVLNSVNNKYTKHENLKEYYKEERWLVCGGMFITGKDIGLKLLSELNNIYKKHTLAGYGHGEEMFYLELLDKHYDEIEKSYGDYKQILNNFLDINLNLDYILRISQNFLNNKSYKECINCCTKAIERYESYKIEINYKTYFRFLFNLYLASYYHLGKELASEVVTKIINLSNKNPLIQKVYLNNKQFYDKQFLYATYNKNVQKVLICGFPHCGTSILKKVIGHIPDVEEIVLEASVINKKSNKQFILCKWPFTFDKYFEKSYEDYIKILIIRNPLFVFSSLNKRFIKNGIPSDHSIEAYINTIKKFIKYRNSQNNIYTIRYEDIFDNNNQELRIVLDDIGMKYENNIFNNTEYINKIDPKCKVPSEKPTDVDHTNYRTWQVNQPFISNNDVSKLDLSEIQIQQIINDDNILKIYPNIKSVLTRNKC